MKSKVVVGFVSMIALMVVYTLCSGQTRSSQDVGRYQVVSVHFQTTPLVGTKSEDVYAVMKVDTMTGDTWQLFAGQLPDGRFTQKWITTTTN